MRDLIDINSTDAKLQNEAEVPFLKGAYISFWSDVDGAFTEKYEKLSKELDGEQLAYCAASQVIADWNLSFDKKTKLSVTKESIAKLSPKLRTWLVDRTTEVIFPIGITDKKKASPNN